MGNIRLAKLTDIDKIKHLLEILDYSETDNFLYDKLKKMLKDPNEVIFVYEENNEVLAFMSVHFIPQIALKGDFARISYFSVDDKKQGRGIGTKMERYCVELAQQKNCDRIELHCHSRRNKAHKFYLKQGYVDNPKYFFKKV